MLKYFLEIYHFYLFQGHKLQFAIENIDVHSILTKDIWVLKRSYFSPANCWKHPQSPKAPPLKFCPLKPPFHKIKIQSFFFMLVDNLSTADLVCQTNQSCQDKKGMRSPVLEISKTSNIRAFGWQTRSAVNRLSTSTRKGIPFSLNFVNW